jgi:hypothetical protein
LEAEREPSEGTLVADLCFLNHFVVCGGGGEVGGRRLCVNLFDVLSSFCFSQFVLLTLDGWDHEEHEVLVLPSLVHESRVCCFRIVWVLSLAFLVGWPSGESTRLVSGPSSTPGIGYVFSSLEPLQASMPRGDVFS